MPKSNIRILTKDELKHFNDTYEFMIDNDNVLTKVRNYDRTTAHSLHKKFALRTVLRKLTISVDAITLWSEYFYHKYRTNQNKDMYSLIDVQNAVNILIVSYQEITFNNVLDVLRKSKI